MSFYLAMKIFEWSRSPSVLLGTVDSTVGTQRQGKKNVCTSRGAHFNCVFVACVSVPVVSEAGNAIPGKSWCWQAFSISNVGTRSCR